MSRITKIIIIGSSGHAKVIIDIIEAIGTYEIVGLIDDYRIKNQDETLGYKVLGRIEDLAQIKEDLQLEYCVIAIGDNYARAQVYAKIANLGFTFVTLQHPTSCVSSTVSLGEGNVIMPGVVINSSAEVGNFCVLNTQATIEHDVRIGNFSSIGPMAVLAGNVAVGNGTAIGMNTSVIEKYTIGNNSVIGAFSLVNKNIGNEVLAYGIPIKSIRKRDKGEKYLR